MTRREFRDLASPDRAREALRELHIAAETESVPLVAADGRTLAERVDAAIDVPGFDRAAMDGYAVRATDTFGATETDPVTLAVAGTVEAGTEPTTVVDDGVAVQVATGAVLPEGADAVVPVERTVEREASVEIQSAVAPGDSVMPRGADIAAGDRAFGPGTTLGPRHVGLLAALGRESVPVRGRPRVAVVSTGEELVQPSDDLDPGAGQIYDVNSHTIAAAVEAAGGEPTRHVPATDDADELRETLAAAAEAADLVVTSGSTSAGSADLLYRLVEDHGEILVHGVALKPGRPLLVGRVFDTPYVGLPGYPVSALSVFRTFVAPRLRAATGQPEPETATVEAELATRVRYDGGRLRLVAVGLVADGTGSHLAYAPVKGSGATTTLAETDGVVRMPADTALLDAGDAVTVERFDDAPLPSLLTVGDPDPAAGRLFDGFDAARHLSLAPADADRWLADGIPDALVVPDANPWQAGGHELARWRREWGVVVPADNPAGLSGLPDLVDDTAFANLSDDLALRAAFDDALAEAGVDRDAIDGYNRDLPGLASATYAVDAGRSDAGLGLRATAERLGLGFVPCGWQSVSLVANDDRTEKASVRQLDAACDDDLAAILADLPGYEPA